MNIQVNGFKLIFWLLLQVFWLSSLYKPRVLILMQLQKTSWFITHLRGQGPDASAEIPWDLSTIYTLFSWESTTSVLPINSGKKNCCPELPKLRGFAFPMNSEVTRFLETSHHPAVPPTQTPDQGAAPPHTLASEKQALLQISHIRGMLLVQCLQHPFGESHRRSPPQTLTFTQQKFKAVEENQPTHFHVLMYRQKMVRHF